LFCGVTAAFLRFSGGKCGGIAYLPQQNSKKTVDNVKAAYYNV
jgi:hypothetical protein